MAENVMITAEMERTMLQLVEDFNRNQAIYYDVMRREEETGIIERTEQEELAIALYKRDNVYVQKVQRSLDAVQNMVKENTNGEIDSLIPTTEDFAKAVVTLTGGFNEDVMATLDKVDNVPFDAKYPNGIVSSQAMEMCFNSVLQNPNVNAKIQGLLPNADKLTVKDALDVTQYVDKVCIENNLSINALPEQILATLCVKAIDGVAYDLSKNDEEKAKDEPVKTVEQDEPKETPAVVEGIGGEALNTSKIDTKEGLKAVEDKYKYKESEQEIDHKDEPIAGQTQRDKAEQEQDRTEKAIIAGVVTAGLTGNAGAGLVAGAVTKAKADGGRDM